MIVAVNVGAAFDMNFLDEISGINAVVFFAQQGTMGGKAFADLVSGEATPSGKLADTWAQHYEDIPFAKEYSYLNGNLNEEHYKEGIYVGYRYFDSFHVTPKYPIGYGLSYTTFSWDMEEIVVDQTKITVSVRVKNTGEQYAGKEVLQLYVSCPEGRIEKEYQKLAAFAKEHKVDLTVIGMDDPLVGGIVDCVRGTGTACIWTEKKRGDSGRIKGIFQGFDEEIQHSDRSL